MNSSCKYSEKWVCLGRCCQLINLVLHWKKKACSCLNYLSFVMITSGKDMHLLRIKKKITCPSSSGHMHRQTLTQMRIPSPQWTLWALASQTQGSQNNVARMNWSTEQARRVSFTGVLFFGFCVLQAGLILFPGLWVKVKLHGLCKVHNSSTNEAWLFSFEKKPSSQGTESQRNPWFINIWMALHVSWCHSQL